MKTYTEAEVMWLLIRQREECAKECAGGQLKSVDEWYAAVVGATPLVIDEAIPKTVPVERFLAAVDKLRWHACTCDELRTAACHSCQVANGLIKEIE